MTSQVFFSFFFILPVLACWKIKRLLTMIHQLCGMTRRDFKQHELSVSLAFVSKNWLPSRPLLHLIVLSMTAILPYR